MTLVKEHVSRLEFCRMCFEAKDSFVDAFETVLFRDGCILADKLNELYGFEASPDDEQSKFICIDCVKTIKMLGNMTYGLWSTLDYLVRMHEDKQNETTSFNIPRDSLDFLFLPKKECISQPVVLQTDIDVSRTSEMECSENNGMDCVGSEVEEPVEYCWCSECNAEFLNKEELKIHLKTHDSSVSQDIFCEATESVESSMEFKLLSGEFSLLKNRLCCGKCLKEFRSEKRLVKHIERHDFKCKPRRFERLISLLNSLKSTNPEGNTLLNIPSYNSSSEIDYKIHYSKATSVCGSIDSGSSEDSKCFQQGIVSEIYVSTHSHGNVSSDNSKGFPIVKTQKISRVSTAHVGSNPSLTHSLKQDICGVNNPTIDGNEIEKDVTMLGKSLQSRDPNALSPVLDEKSFYGNVMCVDAGIVVCDYCNKSFTLKYKLREHMVMCHLSVVVHKCFTCYNVFPSESELKTHCAVHTSKSKYICTLCNDNFSSRQSMTLHLREVHGCKKGCTCGVCFLGFSSQVELGLHQLCHKADKKYKCSKCGKSYMNKYYYNSHVKICHLRREAHQCQICGKKFSTKHNMDVHSFTHGSVKRFSCHLCQKQFTGCSRLHVHIRCVHLKLKPHECGICHRRFSVREHLSHHYAVHSDDRPFSCELCGKTFKLKFQVHEHMKKVHCKA